MIEGLRNEVLSNLKNQYKKNLVFKKDLFNITSARSKIVAETDGTLFDLVMKSVKKAYETAGFIPPPLKDLETMARKIVKNSSSMITDSINVINENLKTNIQNMIENNPLATADELYDKLVENIDGKFDSLKASRAANIAQTTSTFTECFAQKETFLKMGLSYLWLSQRDDVVRPAHRVADGQKQVDGFFNVGGEKLEHPASGGSASNVCNCRCYLYPYKEKE